MDSTESNQRKHKALKFLLIVVVSAIYTVFVGFSVYRSRSRGFFNFDNATTNDAILDYRLEINPSPWTFYVVWGCIYLWQFLWLGYSLATLCRSTDYGYLYVRPNVLPVGIFICFPLMNACSILWSFLYRSLYIPQACAVLALMAFLLYICVFFSVRALDKHGWKLVKQQKGADIWMIRIFFHNGLGMYATWCTIATLLNLATALVFWADLPNEAACTISLAILASELLVWFVVDITALDKYTRYLLTPYIVAVFALCGIIVQNWNPFTLNFIFNAVLLGVATVFLLVKFLIALVKCRRDPLDYKNTGASKSETSYYWRNLTYSDT
ncbi:unnamed protein product [Owenia fusiformis]|uniref:Uncharacterized protein n=1 Tax=Owenia fusiformis TaxID=6347 RepID=A0A8J1XM95_OWEFU|nr:unnamed protein product [Owenia fusiformis]